MPQPMVDFFGIFGCKGTKLQAVRATQYPCRVYYYSTYVLINNLHLGKSITLEA